MCWQGTPTHRHYIQELNVVINELKRCLVIDLRKRIVHFLFYFNLKIVRFFCRTQYNTESRVWQLTVVITTIIAVEKR
jgi:hypothetical protein